MFYTLHHNTYVEKSKLIRYLLKLLDIFGGHDSERFLRYAPIHGETFRSNIWVIRRQIFFFLVLQMIKKGTYYFFIPTEQKYFVRTTKLFCQANQQILLRQQMIYWADKKISLPQQKHFVRPTKQFCQTNKPNNKILLPRQNSFVAQITTKLFCCGKKILVGQAVQKCCSAATAVADRPAY